MKKEPLVSVIVPVYNTAKYLDQCLSSVVNQTYHNLQIIVVDDGSTDNSSLRCDEWGKKDQRITVIHQENKGLSGARNTGLKKANGVYVAFIDSDDYYSKSIIEKMVFEMLIKHVDMVMCQYEIFNSNGETSTPSLKRTGEPEKVLSRREFLNLLLDDDEITNHVWRKLYTRRLLPPDPFPEGQNMEDVYAMPDMIARSTSICCINDIGYHYRINSNGILHSSGASLYIDGYCAQKYSCTKIAELEPKLKNKAENILISDLLDYVINYETNKLPESANYLVNKSIKLIKDKSLGFGLSKRKLVLQWLVKYFPALVGPYCRIGNLVRNKK